MRTPVPDLLATPDPFRAWLDSLQPGTRVGSGMAIDHPLCTFLGQHGYGMCADLARDCLTRFQDGVLVQVPLAGWALAYARAPGGTAWSILAIEARDALARAIAAQ